MGIDQSYLAACFDCQIYNFKRQDYGKMNNKNNSEKIITEAVINPMMFTRVCFIFKDFKNKNCN